MNIVDDAIIESLVTAYFLLFDDTLTALGVLSLLLIAVLIAVVLLRLWRHKTPPINQKISAHSLILAALALAGTVGLIQAMLISPYVLAKQPSIEPIPSVTTSYPYGLETATRLPVVPALPTTTPTPTPTDTPTPTSTGTSTPTSTSTPTYTPSLTPTPEEPPPPPDEGVTSTPVPPCYGTGIVNFLGLYNGQVFDRAGVIRIRANVNAGTFSTYSIRYVLGTSGPEAVDRWSPIVHREPLGSNTIDYIWSPLPAVGTYTIRLQLWDGDVQFEPQRSECAVTIRIQ